LKLNLATTLKDGVGVDMRSMTGKPSEGRTLEHAIKQVGFLSYRRPKIVLVNPRMQNLKASEACDRDRRAALAERCTR
jgi:hypothetical protein